MHFSLTFFLFFRLRKQFAQVSRQKKWKFAWTSIPILDFNDCKFFNDDTEEESTAWHFVKFVGRVLSLHDAFFITKFILCCELEHKPSCIRSWVSATIMCNVEELDTSIPDSDSVSLPHCLYACGRLKVLKLGGPFVLTVPTLVCLNSLKIVSLCGVQISNCFSLKKLLPGCPLVDELEIRYSWTNAKTLHISSVSLEKLKREKLLMCANSNTTGCGIVIDTKFEVS
ncbi:hypothetical protein SLA2020_305450 [Shorea laevis]